jgi:hypothetical protein
VLNEPEFDDVLEAAHVTTDCHSPGLRSARDGPFNFERELDGPEILRRIQIIFARLIDNANLTMTLRVGIRNTRVELADLQ